MDSAAAVPERRNVYGEYDRSRDFSGKCVRSACYAPFTNLYFDTLGNVRACCHNRSHPLGNVGSMTIDEIWNGEPLKKLRAAVAGYDLTMGCGFCQFQISEGCSANLSMRRWDHFEVESQDPEWPAQMEFSISNACNLECLMCRGECSSAIRARREKLPPLPKAYRPAFFDQLRKYLPHLRTARFLGGEPFLQEECYRIWEMMIEAGLQTRCHVTTNGTQFHARVKRVLERLPTSICVSIDGASKRTYEGIRKNSNYDELMENCARLKQLCAEKGESFSFTFCLMRQNWHEFGAMCLLAEEWEASLWLNTVTNPPEFGVYTLPRGELLAVAESLERESPALLPKLRVNRGIWEGELQRLRSKAGIARD